MPIIINDFELVVEDGSEPRRGGGGPDEQPAGEQQQPLRPVDIVEAVRFCAERLERVRAD